MIFTKSFTKASWKQFQNWWILLWYLNTQLKFPHHPISRLCAFISAIFCLFTHDVFMEAWRNFITKENLWNFVITKENSLFFLPHMKKAHSKNNHHHVEYQMAMLANACLPYNGTFSLRSSSSPFLLCSSLLLLSGCQSYCQQRTSHDPVSLGHIFGQS